MSEFDKIIGYKDIKAELIRLYCILKSPIWINLPMMMSIAKTLRNMLTFSHA